MPIMIIIVILLVAAARPLHGGGSGVYTRMPIARVLKGLTQGGTHGMPLE